MNPIERHPHTSPGRQSGMALIVGLLLLVVVTLIGLAGIRGTLTQHIMASNFYDRELAFQSAEAALRVGEQDVAGIPVAGPPAPAGGDVPDCSPTTPPTCLSTPLHPQHAFPSPKIQTNVFSAGNIAAGQPRYAIQYLGQFTFRGRPRGQMSNNFSYGGQGASRAYYYSITAQNGDPANLAGRAVVTLQTIVMR